MRRERLKDQIEDPRVSVFDSFVRAVVVLISMGAVYYALSGRGFPVAVRGNAGAAPAVETASELTLTATRDHQFYWEKTGPIPIAEAAARLAAWRKTTAAAHVIVAADESALLGDALALYHEAHRLGIADVRIEPHTRPTP
jgi:biopolymer transport protein ExbD